MPDEADNQSEQTQLDSDAIDHLAEARLASRVAGYSAPPDSPLSSGLLHSSAPR